MPKVVARISHVSYPIVVGDEALQELDSFIKGRNYSNCVLIVDKKLKALKTKIVSMLKHEYPKIFVIELASVEETKNFKKIYPLYAKLLSKKIDRNSIVIAVGGGVIGDTAGFLASTYLRGIPWVVVPTTLLSQVDSSIGGKTGVNHEAGKNLIGSFYQPSGVFCNPNFLKTLPRRELIAGLAETFKYSFILDKYFFFEFIDKLDGALNLDVNILNEFVIRSVRWKLGVVSQDERDRSGIRQLLNFGHTFGHAIESYFNYQRFNHGESVALGMKFAVIVSFLKGLLPNHEFAKAVEGLNKLKIPKLPLKMNSDRLWQLMATDKKNSANVVNMVLLKSIGRAVVNQKLEKKEFTEALRIIREGL